MAMGLLRNRRPGGSRKGGLTMLAASEADRIRDRLSWQELSRSAGVVSRLVGLTRSGYIALAGAVMLWVVARVVAGDAMYVASYGAAAFVVAAVFLAPPPPGTTAGRVGLYPPTRGGERREVQPTPTGTLTRSPCLLG